MAAINVALCVVAVVLTCRPLLLHAVCKVNTCSPRVMYPARPLYVITERKGCLICTNMTKDELLNDLHQPKHKNVNGLRTYSINFSDIPVNEPQFLNMVYIEINDNNENFTSLRYFKMYNIKNNAFGGFYISTRYNLTMDFRNNSIKTLNSLCLGHYPQEWSLLLGKNQIESFSKSVVEQSNCSSTLRWLDLRYNELTSLSADIFLELPSLETLDVEFNQISSFNNNLLSYYEISKTIKSFPSINIKKIYMDDNQLSQLNDESFKYFYNLEYLSLSDNKLKYISPGAFSDLKQLQTLFLSDNFLTYIDPKTFSSLDSLRNLSIQRNKLVIFELWNFQPNSNTLEYFTLGQNQWECGALDHLMKYLSSKHVDYRFHGDLKNNSDNIRGIDCYTSNIIPRIIQLGYDITRHLHQQTNLSRQQQTSEQGLIEINIAEFEHLLRHLIRKHVNNTYFKGCNNFNVSGAECVKYMLQHIKQLEETIEDKTADLRNALNETRNSLHKTNNSLNDTKNSLHDTRILLNETRVYIRILTGVLAALVDLLVCVGVYRRYRGGRERDEQAEVERAPPNIGEPVYHYVELPGDGRNQRESCIYEELNGPRSSPDQGAEYVVMSHVVAADDDEPASSPVYDQLA